MKGLKMSNREQYVESCKEVIERVLVPGQTLIQYVRTKKGMLRGVVVAFRNPRSNEINIGWSLCNIKEERFDKTIGLNKAVTRSVQLISWVYDSELPHTVRDVYDMVRERARKFFKVD